MPRTPSSLLDRRRASSVVLLAFALLTGCGTQPARVYTQWPFDAKEAAKRQDQTAKALAALFGWFNASGNQSKDDDLQDKLDRVCERVRRLLPEDAFSD